MSLLTFQSLGRRLEGILEGFKDGHSPKAYKGHLVATIELDGRGSHAGVCVRSECDSLKMDWRVELVSKAQ